MKNTLFTRRSLLKAVGLGSAITAVYSYYRGIRFPVLSWEPKALKTTFSSHGVDCSFDDLILINNDSNSTSFRAFAPEPELRLSTQKNQSLVLIINNIAQDAVLNISGHIPTENKDGVKEEIQGITRKISISLKGTQSISLKWQLPELKNYKFAAIGDTGGDKELGWCIQRAHQLGARFLLHLGDFNYQQGDYENSIEQFNRSLIPCYVTIGNHDFNESGLIYQQFLDQIGPLNYYFSIGKTRYINIDTAASMLPYSGGLRGQLMEKLAADKGAYNSNVAFTHRPIHDPQPLHIREENGSHDLGSEGETNWLIRSLKRINATTLLSGHIHIFDRTTYRGIDNIIVGQGLGHQDLIVNDNEISKMAIGHVDEYGKVEYRFASLAMPMELHCHPRIQVVKDSVMNQPHAAQIREIDEACALNSTKQNI